MLMRFVVLVLAVQVRALLAFTPQLGTTRPSVAVSTRQDRSVSSSPCPKPASRQSSPLKASNDNESDFLLKALRQRQLELQGQQQDRANRWKTADCDSGVRLVLPNWVRRLDVGEWPLVATGSGRGDVYVGNLETGDVMAIGQVEEDEDETEFEQAKQLETVVRVLFNGYDGGGTLAVAFSGTLICEGRRSGGVHLWRLDPRSDRLMPQGSIPGVGDDTLVTTLHLDDDYLWVGTVDGQLQAYSVMDPEFQPLALQQKPAMSWKFGQTITSLALCPAHGCGAVATAAGNVHLFSLDDPSVVLGSFYPPFDSPERKSIQAFASSVTFVEINESEKDDKGAKSSPSANLGSLLVACGGNDGSIFLQPVEISPSTGDIDTIRPFAKPLRPLRPRHFGPCKCLASPVPGVLVSAGQDGGLRVWDVQDDNTCLYQFVGYKVWMGSLWTDGDRLVSDGADNTVVVHDFTKGSEP